MKKKTYRVLGGIGLLTTAMMVTLTIFVVVVSIVANAVGPALLQ